MLKLYADAGTSWSKVLEIYQDEKDLDNSALNAIKDLKNYLYSKYNSNCKATGDSPLFKRTFIFPSSYLSGFNILFDKATGHMAKEKMKQPENYQNEVLSLAYGAIKLINDLSDSTIVDIGSRDLKWVRFFNNKYRDLDWNGSCGSVTGATVEMLCRFYSLNPGELIPQKERIPVTCGVFAMEKIMDDIALNVAPEVAVAKYIHGIAYNTWVFAKSPDKIYLSGGFCLNKCFISSLENYCKVIPIGRFALLEGLCT
jgi:activator of 2-hydroxyglutaryl-CoA dehydratase